MRNLKRALSLTLASVMLLGMMVFGTSAASFTDADQITNETAATVLQELKVMQGSNGKFNPTGTVTRGQMAILICKMLYGDKLNAENFAGTSQFTDVPANAYYTGYVNLASQLGIISGYGNGKFGPGAPVTTAQAALMLTRALGWFQAGELENQSWTSNAIAAVERATAVNLFGSMKLANDAPLSRDNVCEMVFNAMTKTAPVNYNSRWEMYYSDESSIMSGVKFDYSNSLGYKNFTLVYNTTKSDDFGRPSTEWGIGNGRGITTDDHGDIVSATIRTSILKAADEANASYTEEVKGKDLYGDLGLSETTTATVILDGGKPTTFKIEKSSDTVLPNSGNGVIVEAYKNSDNKVTIVIMQVQSGKITKVTPAKDNDDRYVTVNGKNFDTEGFAKDDIVIYTVADGAIKTMALANKVEGVTVTRRSGTSNFTAGGDTYKYNKIQKSDVEKDVKVGSVLDLYLDGNGYVVKVDVSKSTTDNAYVLDTRVSTGYSEDKTYYVKLLMADGTTVTDAKLDKDNCKDSSGNAITLNTEESLSSALKNHIVEYTKDSKDVYSVTVKSTAKLAEVTYVADQTHEIKIENGKAAMTLDQTTRYADSKTVFLVKNGDNWASYTGYNAVPTLKKTAADGESAGSFAVYVDGSIAKVVVVTGVAAESSDIVYVLSSKAGTEVKEEGKDTYYEYKAVVNGEITTVKAKAKIDGADKLYKTIVYSNADQEIIDFAGSTLYTTSGDNKKVSGNVTKEYGKDTVGIDSVVYAVADDVQVFAVTKGDKIEDGDLDDLIEKDTAKNIAGTKVDAIFKDGKIVTLFYEKAEKTSSGGNTSKPDVDTSEGVEVGGTDAGKINDKLAEEDTVKVNGNLDAGSGKVAVNNGKTLNVDGDVKSEISSVGKEAALNVDGDVTAEIKDNKGTVTVAGETKNNITNNGGTVNMSGAPTGDVDGTPVTVTNTKADDTINMSNEKGTAEVKGAATVEAAITEGEAAPATITAGGTEAAPTEITLTGENAPVTNIVVPEGTVANITVPEASKDKITVTVEAGGKATLNDVPVKTELVVGGEAAGGASLFAAREAAPAAASVTIEGDIAKGATVKVIEGSTLTIKGKQYAPVFLEGAEGAVSGEANLARMLPKGGMYTTSATEDYTGGAAAGKWDNGFADDKKFGVEGQATIGFIIPLEKEATADGPKKTIVVTAKDGSNTAWQYTTEAASNVWCSLIRVNVSRPTAGVAKEDGSSWPLPAEKTEGAKAWGAGFEAGKTYSYTVTVNGTTVQSGSFTTAAVTE